MSQKAIKKRLILQAAIEVFSKSSFRDSSISEIAGKANAAEGVLLFAVLYLLFLWQGL
jgi:AcrR family transcriptional regulator